MRRWKAHRGKIASLSFSRDGQLLASVTGSGRDSFIWDATAGELARKLTAGNLDGTAGYSATTAVDFARDADLLAVARRDWVEVWDSRTWSRLAGMRYGYGLPSEIELGPGPRPRIAASTASDTHIYDLSEPSAGTFGLTGVAHWESEYHTQLSFTADGTSIATHTIHCAEVREVLSGNLIRRLRHKRASYCGPVRFLPDSSRLAFCYGRVIESHPATLDDPDAVIRYAGHTDKVWMLCYTPDGRTLISASGDGTVRLWEASTGLEKRCFDMKIGKIAAADVSPDGAVAAVGGANGEIVVWDLE